MIPRRSRFASPLLFAQLVTGAALAASCSSDQTTTGSGTAGQSSAGAAGTVVDQGGSSPLAGSGGSIESGGSAPTAGDSGATSGGSGGVSSGGSAGNESGGNGGNGGSAGQTRPNVIFVLTDDLAMNLVQYMPNVLKMKKNGVTFSNYFVTDSLCCPSRTSMFTGKYPHNSGVFTNGGNDGGYATYVSQGNDPQTFAVALKAAGYRTAMMGKFLNGYDQQADNAALGWTQWDVTDNGYPEYGYTLNEDGVHDPHAHTPADYLTDVLSGLGQAFVSKKSPEPFLLEVASFAPHAPYTPAPRHSTLFPNLTAPETAAFNYRPTASDPAWLKDIPALTPQQITGPGGLDEVFRKRAQAVQAVDEMIGALEAKLKATGHDKDTYLFFTSDNGYHIGERSMLPGKQTAFDTDIHVPLIVTGPGVPAGVVVDQMAQNIDLCPTFSEIAETPPPATVNGHSLLQLLHGQTVGTWRNAVLVEHHGPTAASAGPDNEPMSAAAPTKITPPTYDALRTATALYVEYATGETEYHDRAADPFELQNTAASLSAAEVAKLHDAIAAIKTCKTADGCWAAQQLKP